MDIPDGESMAGDGNMADIGNNSSYGTYGAYGYNGEYTHTDLGLQYLRARYYNMITGTFTSRDTYAGTLTDILSQNRYTYAENNPVTYADPSGHAIIRSGFGKTMNSIKNSIQPLGRKIQRTSNVIRNNLFQTDRTTPLLMANTMSVTLNRNLQRISNSIQSIIPSGRSGMSAFVESVAAISERIKCSAYTSCRNSVQDKIRDVTLTAGAATVFDEIVPYIEGKTVSSSISTKDNLEKYPDSLIDFIKNYEFIDDYYDDPSMFFNGKFIVHNVSDSSLGTIAFGHDVQPDEDFGNGLTMRETIELLIQDLDKTKENRVEYAISQLNKNYGYNYSFDDFTEQEQAFLLDFAYNRGWGLVGVNN